ncbi:MAG: VanZ family protein [Clostridia bacterium]|nr:VanZ family protein [Clostridia bacterium]
MLFLKKNKFLAAVFWILSLAVMVMIFMFSSATGEESEAVSQNLLSKIIEFIGNYVSHNFLRKLAHFCEFAALGFCVTGAVHFTFGKRKFYVPLIPCILYAVSDEVHQHFVPERACRVFDMFVDTCGIMTGIGIFLLLILIISKSIKKKEP